MHKLQINNLTKTYKNGVRALQHVNLEIANGIFGLLGPNGAGKSSLMRTLVGLQDADSGEIFFNGENVLKNPMIIKRQSGFLPQDFGVYPKVSTYNLLDHLAILKGVTDKQMRRQQVLNLLDQVNLLSHKDKEVATFSGGMRQRFGVAQALLGNPKMIILDEPTAGLDPEEKHRFYGMIAELGADRIVILSTHLVEDIRNLCSQMSVMDKGEIVAFGKPSHFIGQLDGKLFQKDIPKDQVEFYKSNHHVISTQFVEGLPHIKIISSNTIPGFTPIFPTLEDAYFSLLTKKEF
jgi:ABC-2 type transport system ATP-binding protein